MKVRAVLARRDELACLADDLFIYLVVPAQRVTRHLGPDGASLRVRSVMLQHHSLALLQTVVPGEHGRRRHLVDVIIHAGKGHALHISPCADDTIEAIRQGLALAEGDFAACLRCFLCQQLAFFVEQAHSKRYTGRGRCTHAYADLVLWIKDVARQAHAGDLLLHCHTLRQCHPRAQRHMRRERAANRL